MDEAPEGKGERKKMRERKKKIKKERRKRVRKFEPPYSAFPPSDVPYFFEIAIPMHEYLPRTFKTS